MIHFYGSKASKSPDNMDTILPDIKLQIRLKTQIENGRIARRVDLSSGTCL
jgi:hypothetical protein